MIEIHHPEQVAREEAGYPHRALRSTIRGQRAVRCDTVREHIKALPRSGPSPWSEIQVPMMQDGVRQRIHPGIGSDGTAGMEQVSQAWARPRASRSCA
ncbi:hypothetical protein [Streptomyces sp. JH34]|uniref:hypothetical protein n=1 Tax=Streptomyces sp. JH34 TaxID=2793633 RepID=UPI0023F81B7B|nr:hypothetical protein [Streptomyces sp. JH34]MDF6017056.1 hypothetical protein [Streptomyces sp. JH34]